MGERTRLIAEVDVKIADIEAEHSTLVDQARELGIRLELLPAESARRLQAQQRREFVAAQNRVNADAIRRGVAEPMR